MAELLFLCIYFICGLLGWVLMIHNYRTKRTANYPGIQWAFAGFIFLSVAILVWLIEGDKK